MQHSPRIHEQIARRPDGLSKSTAKTRLSRRHVMDGAGSGRIPDTRASIHDNRNSNNTNESRQVLIIAWAAELLIPTAPIGLHVTYPPGLMGLAALPPDVLLRTP